MIRSGFLAAANWVPDDGVSGLPPLQGIVYKCIKSFILITSLSLGGCGASQQRPRELRIQELERQNQELEAQLTLLQERALAKERSYCKSEGNTRAHSTDISPADELQGSTSNKTELSARTPSPRARGGGAPTNLPIVRLSPDGASPSYSSSPSEEPHSEIVSPPPSGSAGSELSSRPVLKVHGSNEGRVLHRALSSTESEETSP